MSKKETNYKIMIVSEFDSGKTNFINAYKYNKHEKKTPRTISIDFFTKTFNLNNKEIIIFIYDSPSSFSFFKTKRWNQIFLE